MMSIIFMTRMKSLRQTLCHLPEIFHFGGETSEQPNVGNGILSTGERLPEI